MSASISLKASHTWGYGLGVRGQGIGFHELGHVAGVRKANARAHFGRPAPLPPQPLTLYPQVDMLGLQYNLAAAKRQGSPHS